MAPFQGAALFERIREGDDASAEACGQTPNRPPRRVGRRRGSQQICLHRRLEGNEYDLIFKVFLCTAPQQQCQILDCPDQRQFLFYDDHAASSLSRTHSVVCSCQHRLSIVSYKRLLVLRCPLKQRGILGSRQTGFLHDGIQQPGTWSSSPRRMRWSRFSSMRSLNMDERVS